jgi:glycosyltransferase involved in cell wall biosynthesis
MRIGIDARELAGHVTGVGRFLAGLLREWSTDAAAAHEFVLYAPEPIAAAIDVHRFQTIVVPGGAGTWWEQVRLADAVRHGRLDVLFAPGYTAPLRVAVPTVAAIYDLSYFAHPEWFGLREGTRRRWVTQQTAARARAVITLSAFARREVIERLNVPDHRVHVVLPGIDRRAADRRDPTGPRVLFVGSIFNRRHVPDLIRAVAVLAERHPTVSLDIVGDNRTFPYEDLDRAIDAFGARPRVRWHRFATDEVLGELYGQARAFAFLSEYEGLGMTPLEALAAGIPPVLFDTAVARESCGGAALYVPQGDHYATERAIEKALFDEGVRSTTLGAAPAVLARYDWPRAARDTLAVIEAAGTND